MPDILHIEMMWVWWLISRAIFNKWFLTYFFLYLPVWCLCKIVVMGHDPMSRVDSIMFCRESAGCEAKSDCTIKFLDGIIATLYVIITGFQHFYLF